MKGYNLGPLKDRIRTIGMVFEDCRYLNRQMYELGLEPAVKAIEASRNFTCLTSENEYNAGNILQVWRQLAPLQWLLMLEMLRYSDYYLENVMRRPYMNSSSGISTQPFKHKPSS